MVNKTRALYDRWGVGVPDPTQVEYWAVRRADNIAWCSCYSCGNPRRHFGFCVYGSTDDIRTLQEIRSDDNFKEQLDDLSSVE